MFVATTKGAAVMYWHSPKDSMATEIDYDIHWVASGGSTREAKITLPWAGGATQTVLFGVEAPMPAFVLGSTAILRTRELLDNGLAATYDEALSRALTEYWPAIAIAQLIALALAGLCYRRQVRYGAGGIERIVWPMFVLVLGLPGWIGYRFSRFWPVLDTCPTCRGVIYATARSASAARLYSRDQWPRGRKYLVKAIQKFFPSQFFAHLKVFKKTTLWTPQRIVFFAILMMWDSERTIVLRPCAMLRSLFSEMELGHRVPGLV